MLGGDIDLLEVLVVEAAIDLRDHRRSATAVQVVADTPSRAGATPKHGLGVGVLKGAPNPNAGKLLIEFLLSEEGSDIFVEGEAVYSMRAGYKPPAAAAPYLLDLSNTKLLGMKDWVVQAAKDATPARELWQENFR